MRVKVGTPYTPGLDDSVMILEKGTLGTPLTIILEMTAMSGPLTNVLKSSAVVKLGKTSCLGLASFSWG